MNPKFRTHQLDGKIVVVIDMNDEERKIYRILLERMRRMAEENESRKPVQPSVDSISFLGMTFSSSEWNRFKIAWETHVCDNLGARLTSVRKDSSMNFYVANPSGSQPWKPYSYFEMGRDVGFKILALGYLP